MRWIALLLVASLAGCVNNADPTPTPSVDDEPERLPAQGIDWTLLSQDEHTATAPQQHYVASHDGILLHVVVHLPSGEGPWPTILQNSPYYSHPNNGVTTIGLVGQYVPKGYAVVSADVRGTGNSEGCMNMMGDLERKDTYELVEWIAAQGWSDGHVGMQGVSYVGTTPHEALIEAPPHLDTVVTVAGVVNQCRNVYQGGVPYLARFYPITYEATEGAPPPTDFNRGAPWLLNTLDAACGQEEALQAMAPGTYEKGVYSAYWDERNFTKHVDGAQASLLYSQGFVDRAVNPIEAVGWFNELPVPKKAFLHQGGHQYPPREDYFDTELAWFDYWLKGIDNGIMDTPTVEVQLNDGRIRTDTTWPPEDATSRTWHLAPGRLDNDVPDSGFEGYVAGPPGAVLENPFGAPLTPLGLTYTSAPLANSFLLTGSAQLHLQGGVATLTPADNVYWLFDLYDVGPGGSTWIAEGWFNGHLRDGFDRIAPMVGDIAYDYTVTFEPRDYVFAQGHQIQLVARGYDDGVFPWDEPVAVPFIEYGEGASHLELPTVAEPRIYDAPTEVTDGIP